MDYRDVLVNANIKEIRMVRYVEVEKMSFEDWLADQDKLLMDLYYDISMETTAELKAIKGFDILKRTEAAALAWFKLETLLDDHYQDYLAE